MRLERPQETALRPDNHVQNIMGFYFRETAMPHKTYVEVGVQEIYDKTEAVAGDGARM